jgi:hypothetical protein
MRVTHHHTSATIIGFVVMMTLGCDGSNGPPTGPTTGSMQITVSTQGANPDLDIDGYGVVVDDRAPMAIGVQGVLTIAGLAPGSHFVNLDGLASNCYIVAANQRRVHVVASGLAQLVVYNVLCIPRGIGGPSDGCPWDCFDWSQSAALSKYGIVSAKGRVFKPARVP